MTADQITALGSIIISAASASVAVGVRYFSRAGKLIRKQRKALEAAEEHMMKLRLMLIARGIPAARLPRVPQALQDLDSWQHGDLGGADENDTADATAE